MYSCNLIIFCITTYEPRRFTSRNTETYKSNIFNDHLAAFPSTTGIQRSEIWNHSVEIELHMEWLPNSVKKG